MADKAINMEVKADPFSKYTRATRWAEDYNCTLTLYVNYRENPQWVTVRLYLITHWYVLHYTYYCTRKKGYLLDLCFLQCKLSLITESLKLFTFLPELTNFKILNKNQSSVAPVKTVHI